MKIQSSMFLSNAKKLTNLLRSRTERINVTDDVSIKKSIVKTGSKILNIRLNKSVNQSEISKEQHVREGLKELLSMLNDMSTTDKEKFYNVSKVLSEEDYGGEKPLNDYMKTLDIEKDLSSGELVSKIESKISEVSNNISRYTGNINELNVSESNLLSTSDINQGELFSILRNIKDKPEQINLLHNAINDKDIKSLLIG